MDFGYQNILYILKEFLPIYSYNLRRIKSIVMKVVNFRFPKQYIKNKNTLKKSHDQHINGCELFCKEALKIMDTYKNDSLQTIKNMLTNTNLEYLKTILNFYNHKNTKITQAANKLIQLQCQARESSLIVSLKNKVCKLSSQLKFLHEQLQRKKKENTLKQMKINRMCENIQSKQNMKNKYTVIGQILHRSHTGTPLSKLVNDNLHFINFVAPKGAEQQFNKKMNKKKSVNQSQREKQNLFKKTGKSIKSIKKTQQILKSKKYQNSNTQIQSESKLLKSINKINKNKQFSEDELSDHIFSEPNSQRNIGKQSKKQADMIKQNPFLEQQIDIDIIDKVSECRQIQLSDNSMLSDDNSLI